MDKFEVSRISIVGRERPQAFPPFMENHDEPRREDLRPFAPYNFRNENNCISNDKKEKQMVLPKRN